MLRAWLTVVPPSGSIRCELYDVRNVQPTRIIESALECFKTLRPFQRSYTKEMGESQAYFGCVKAVHPLNHTSLYQLFPCFSLPERSFYSMASLPIDIACFR